MPYPPYAAREAADPPKPSVSVIIPAYDAAELIGETLASVKGQTYESYEVIVINDGSPDTQLLERILHPYRERLVYLKQENAGPSAARNHGIRHARGELLAFLDADDVWGSDFLAEQMAFLATHPNVDLVYANAAYIGDGIAKRGTFMSNCPSDGEVTVERLLAGRCNVITSGVLVRKQAVLEAGLFDPAENRGEDFDLWLRLAKQGSRMAYQRRVLLRRRIHADSLSADRARSVEGALRILAKFGARSDLTPPERIALQKRREKLTASGYLATGKTHLVSGEFAAAAAAFRRANAYYKSNKLRLVLAIMPVAPTLLATVYRLWRRRVKKSSTAWAPRSFLSGGEYSGCSET